MKIRGWARQHVRRDGLGEQEGAACPELRGSVKYLGGRLVQCASDERVEVVDGDVDRSDVTFDLGDERAELCLARGVR